LKVGDHIDILLDSSTDPPSVEPVTITAIIAYSAGFPSVTGRPDQTIGLSPAFLAAHPEQVDWTNGGLVVKLRGGAGDVPAFRSAVEAAALPVGGIGSAVNVGVRHLVTVEARSLWLLGLIFGAAAMVVVVQMFRRNAVLAANRLRIIEQLGMPRSGLVGTGILHGLRVGALGAIGGGLLAVLASPILPVGVSRTADPHIGIHADLLVLANGTLGTLAIAAAAAAGGVHVATRTVRSERFERRGVGRLSHLGPVMSTGMQSVFGAGLIGPVVAATFLLGASALGSSFDRMLSDPDLAGGTWDVDLVYDDAGPREAAGRALAAEPSVAASAVGGWGGLEVNGQAVYAMIYAPGSGIAPAVDRGRAPVGSSQIALGAAELSKLHVSIGDTVDVGRPRRQDAAPDGVPRRVVPAVVIGRSVLASPIYQSLAQGQGGAVTTSLLERIGSSPDQDIPGFFVKLRNRGQLAAGYADLTQRLHPNFAFQRADNAAVGSLRHITGLVVLLLVLLSALCGVSMVHRIVVTARRNQRELAILRSVGLTPSQVARCQAVHGAGVAVVTAAIAVPVGLIAAGRAWRRVAGYLFVVPRPDPRAVTVAGGVVVWIVIGASIGLAVGLWNRRTALAWLLRFE
jgi:hypothetical protein